MNALQTPLNKFAYWLVHHTTYLYHQKLMLHNVQNVLKGFYSIQLKHHKACLQIVWLHVGLSSRGEKKWYIYSTVNQHFFNIRVGVHFYFGHVFAIKVFVSLSFSIRTLKNEAKEFYTLPFCWDIFLIALHIRAELNSHLKNEVLNLKPYIVISLL